MRRYSQHPQCWRSFENDRRDSWNIGCLDDTPELAVLRESAKKKKTASIKVVGKFFSTVKESCSGVQIFSRSRLSLDQHHDDLAENRRNRSSGDVDHLTAESPRRIQNGLTAWSQSNPPNKLPDREESELTFLQGHCFAQNFANWKDLTVLLEAGHFFDIFLTI